MARIKIGNIKGPTGDSGVGIKSITYKNTDASGGNVYTITLTNNNIYEFTAPKGAKGDRGDKGEPGESTVVSLKWEDILEKPASFPSTWGTVTGKPTEFTPSAHTHTKGNITDFPTTLKNPTALTISLNGTSQGAYDGGTAKAINITASNVGALPIAGGTITKNLTVAGTFVCNNDVTAFSDVRLKKNIRIIDNALEKLNRISGYTFEFKDQPKTVRAGVLAQEVKEVLPSAVKETDRVFQGNKMLAVNENQIVALLIQAVKELNERMRKAGI